MSTVGNRLNKSFIGIVLIKLLRIGLIVSNVLVTITVFAAVIARALNFNLLAYEEVLTIFVFWLYMLGSAYGNYEKSHIKADILVVMMRESLKKEVISILRDTLSVILGFVFFLWSLQLALWNLELGQQTPVWGLPILIAQSSLVFGLGVGSLYNITYLYDNVKEFYLKRIKKIDNKEKNN